MSKILEIFNCIECPFEKEGGDVFIEHFCLICGKGQKRIEDISKIPDWCPLDDNKLGE